ncbi:hypothetical protein TNCV_1026621 [Trichonephila clavipes]|nr:hypothetical protein TNCV_1026621 [Trichonephila clavipes]
MPRGRHRASFDQVSEFDQRRKESYRDCVGQNEVTVMWIYPHWMQEETMDLWGRSHPPRSTTARDDKRIVRMAMMDHAATFTNRSTTDLAC